MEETSTAKTLPLKSTFMFVKFAEGAPRIVTLKSAPPPSIIDDGDGMAHVAPDWAPCVDGLDASLALDKGLMRLIADVFRRTGAACN